MMWPTFQPYESVMLVAIVAAAITDWRTGKIPNEITLGLWGAGLLLQLLFGDIQVAAIGFSAAFALHFSMWRLGVSRGGDAKLMIGVGAFTGWSEMLEITAWQYILMVPFGLAVLWSRGRLSGLFTHYLWLAEKMRQNDPGPKPEPTEMILGPYILASVLVARATTWFEVFNA